MAEPSYLLVIMDSSGGATRRIKVPRKRVQSAFVGLLISVVITSIALIHGAWHYSDAHQAVILSEENHELVTTLASLESSLPAARFESLRNQEGFRRVWVSSGLGRSPTAFGIGPLSDGPSSLSPPHSPIVILDPPSFEPLPASALPEHLAAIWGKSLKIQNTIEHTLEYFQDAARLLNKTPSIRPVAQSWVTSHFGRRKDPMHQRWVMHKGLDLGGYTGLPIQAPADGVVVWTGNRGGYGKTVVLDHGHGLQTHYAHLDRYRVRRGDEVTRGEVIAEMGSTGKSTGPHLHYEVRRHGEPVDPIDFVLD